MNCIEYFKSVPMTHTEFLGRVIFAIDYDLIEDSIEEFNCLFTEVYGHRFKTYPQNQKAILNQLVERAANFLKDVRNSHDYYGIYTEDIIKTAESISMFDMVELY